LCPVSQLNLAESFYSFGDGAIVQEIGCRDWMSSPATRSAVLTLIIPFSRI
jgi:hypothetical protein